MKILKPYIIELAPTLTHHWYNVWKQKHNGDKGRFVGCFPSSTTILNAYPQSAYLTEWIAKQGWSEAQAIKSAAGERGTNVHAGIEYLLSGQEISQGYMVPGGRYPLSIEEYWRLSVFVDWYNEFKPEILGTEISVFSRKHKYAGRFDCLAKINGEITVLDWKTSSSIHENFPLQVASYAQAIEENSDMKIVQTGIVQVGNKSKSGYRMVLYPEWRDHYKVFRNVQKVWQYDYFDSKKNPKEPPVLDLTDTLVLKYKHEPEEKVKEAAPSGGTATTIKPYDL